MGGYPDASSRITPLTETLGKNTCMHMLLYIIGGFMMVLGLGSLVVQDPGKGLSFIIILVIAVLVAAAVVHADDRPSDTDGE